MFDILKEIQQQRAAQKMMQVFNQIKPKDMHHSPRCVHVCSLNPTCKSMCLHEVTFAPFPLDF